MRYALVPPAVALLVIAALSSVKIAWWALGLDVG